MFYGGFNMNFDFYKPYLPVNFFNNHPVEEIEKLMHDIYQYNDKLKDALYTSKGIKIHVLLNFRYPTWEDNNPTGVPYIFTNALNPFALSSVDDDCSLVTLQFDFNVFLEIYVSARALYRKMGCEFYDLILKIFKWNLKYVYAYIVLILEHVWLDGDCDPVIAEAEKFEDVTFKIFDTIQYSYEELEPGRVVKNVLVTDNISDVMRNVKCYFKSSDWFKRIIDVSSIFKDVNEHMTMEESGMLLDFFGYILGCIYYNRCHRDSIESRIAKKFNMTREDIIFQYYKLEDVTWIPKSSESKKDEEFQKKIEAELKDFNHMFNVVLKEALEKEDEDEI